MTLDQAGITQSLLAFLLGVCVLFPCRCIADAGKITLNSSNVINGFGAVPLSPEYMIEPL